MGHLMKQGQKVRVLGTNFIGSVCRVYSNATYVKVAWDERTREDRLFSEGYSLLNPKHLEVIEDENDE